MTELTEIVAGWPLAASIAAAVTVRGLRAGRRRTALNEALHELRRPLQAIVLASGSAAGPHAADGSAQLAAVAMERLEREINGRELRPMRGKVVAVRPLLESAVGRWRARASLGGGSLALRWRAGGTLVEADPALLAQAFDNLVVNAVEHGGPEIVVEATLHEGRLRVTVADSGRASRPASRRETPAELLARLSGRRRHGHGLAVVKRTAAIHGGSFALWRSEGGSRAVLELPRTVAPVEPAA